MSSNARRRTSHRKKRSRAGPDPAGSGRKLPPAGTRGSARTQGARARGREELSLQRIVRLLRTLHGPPDPPPSQDPFELILFENVAYLASPLKRREAFESLRREIGTRPAALLAASRSALERIASRGILKRATAEKIQECARIAWSRFGGDLRSIVAGPLDAAKRALRLFPGIGEPGAEKILLFAGARPLLAPDSNALRVLTRLGLVREAASYAGTYAAAREASRDLPADVPRMQEAHLLLQVHGQTLCRRTAPHCEACPLARGCAHARSPL
jgi:endonuclease III